MIELPRIQPPESEKLKTFPTSRALRDCLARLPAWQLDTIWARLGLGDRPSRREDRERRIAEWLEEPTHLVEILEHHLDRPHLAILEYLAQFDDDIPIRRLAEADLVDPRGDWLLFNSRRPLGRLRRLGLVHVGLHSIDGRDYVFVGMPVEIAAVVTDWFAARDDTQTVADVVDDLLDRPLTTGADAEQRIAPFEDWEIRDALLDRIAAGDIEERDLFGLVESFAVLGLGDCRDVLESMIADPTPDASDARHLARIAAYSIWSLDAPDDPADQVEILDLPAEEVHALVEDAYVRILGMSESDADLARVAGEQLLNTPPDQRDSFFEETERLRRRGDARAGRVYAPLLADPRYREIWPLLADGILADNHPGDAWLLEQCARRAQGPDAADALRKTAMTLRTRTAGEDPGEEVDGYGLLGGCDGEGAHPVCLVLDHDDQTSFLNAVLRTHPPTLRDGFAIPDITRRELDGLLESIDATGVTELVRVPIETVAGLVQEVIRTADFEGTTLPPDLVETAHHFMRLPFAAPPDVEPDSRPDSVDEGDLADLLSHPLFDGWVFGLSELYEADLWPLPDPDDVDKAWVDRAATALADVPGLRPRLASMCRHMVLWSTYRKGANTAGLFATLVEGVEENFAHSPLVRVMAEQTPAFYDGRPDFGELAPYHQMAPIDQRRQLAERFFGAPEPADRRQDRQLDFIELAFSILQFVRPVIPSEYQPRWEEMIQLAGTLGTEVAELELDDVPVDRPGLRALVEEILADAEWPDTRPEIVYPELTTNFAAALRLDLPVPPEDDATDG